MGTREGHRLTVLNPHFQSAHKTRPAWLSSTFPDYPTYQPLTPLMMTIADT